MNKLDENGAADQIKQGKYANALILILMSIIGAVASYFSYQLGQAKTDYKESRKEDRLEQAAKLAREDSLRRYYQARLDEREKFHEGKYNLAQMRIDSLSNFLIEIRVGRIKSEVLADQSKKTARSFREEVKKTVDVTKQLDSVSNSALKSLQQ